MEEQRSTVGGFIARVADTAHLETYDEIFDNLQLGYPGSAFHPETDECLGLIRFKTEEVSEISIPYSPEMGGTVEEPPPFTGNGFTKAESDIIPEYICDDYLSVSDGAELYEISKDGTQTLKAVYDDSAKRFVPEKLKKGGNVS